MMIAVNNLGRTTYVKSMDIMNRYVNLQLKSIKNLSPHELCVKNQSHSYNMHASPSLTSALDTRKELDTLILVEYEPVYTFGLREASKVPISEINRLERLGADVCYTNRGGLVTFHGPGQLVCYPILNLRHFNMTIKEYVWYLEKLGIMCCNYFGLEAERTENPGVWIRDSKIVSIGVKNQNLITSHGMAFNCDVDLKWFSHIVPCGLLGKGTTSITKETNCHITVKNLTPHFETRTYYNIFITLVGSF